MHCDIARKFESKTVEGQEKPIGLCHRNAVLGTLLSRQSRLEDFDDLKEILPKHFTSKSSFSLAKLIGLQDKNNKTITAEFHGKAVGFMSLSDTVNFDMLESKHNLAQYRGMRSNCFAILFYFMEERHTLRSYEMLHRAFGVFPCHEYCIIIIPTITKDSPLLHYFDLVVPLTANSSCRSLYIFHRDKLATLSGNNMIATLSVDHDDFDSAYSFLDEVGEDVESFGECSGSTKWLLKDLESSQFSIQDGRRCFLFQLSSSKKCTRVIALAIVSKKELENITNVQDLNHIIKCEDRVGKRQSMNSSLIECIVVHKNFKKTLRVFLGEIMRQLGLQSLLYFHDALAVPCQVLINELTQLRPSSSKNGDAFCRDKYALFIMKKSSLVKYKIAINACIVMIGSSISSVSSQNSLDSVSSVLLLQNNCCESNFAYFPQRICQRRNEFSTVYNQCHCRAHTWKLDEN